MCILSLWLSKVVDQVTYNQEVLNKIQKQEGYEGPDYRGIIKIKYVGHLEDGNTFEINGYKHKKVYTSKIAS